MLPENLRTIQRFRILPFHYDETHNSLLLPYQLDDGITFHERIHFPPLQQPLSCIQKTALNRAFQLLQIAAGTSYYKTCVPPIIAIKNGAIDAEIHQFFDTFYKQGLGEFAYRNNLSLDQINFEYQDDDIKSVETAQKDTFISLFGGGKDSLTSLNLLKSAQKNVYLSIINPKTSMLKAVEASQTPLITAQRTLDSHLFDLNKQGALNGHVPITGILSFISVCIAIMQGHKYIVMSNERSANEGNLQNGVDVNHQFSKSFGFETAFSQLIRQKVSSNIHYFSLLRPLSEIQIAHIFSKEEKYDDLFTSCNANFRINNAQKDKLWCGNCPKCRFSFLIFALFMDKERLTRIFDKNMLNDTAQIDGFAELLGFSDNKPWECVGEVAECCAAFYKLSQHDDWKNDAVIAALKDKLLQQNMDFEAIYQQQMTPSTQHIIPKELQNDIAQFLA